MSWWDTAGITNLASQALKNAQKKIDKVLDIDEKTSGSKRKRGTSQQKGTDQKSEKTPEKTGSKKDKDAPEDQGADFWSGWMGSGGRKESKPEDGEKSSDSHSSWNLPWSFAATGSEDQDSPVKSELSVDSNDKQVAPSDRKATASESASERAKSDIAVTDDTSEVSELDEVTGQDVIDSKAASNSPTEAGIASGISSSGSLPDCKAEDSSSGWQDFSLDDNIDELIAGSEGEEKKERLAAVSEFQGSGVVSSSSPTEKESQILFVKNATSPAAKQEDSIASAIPHLDLSPPQAASTSSGFEDKARETNTAVTGETTVLPLQLDSSGLKTSTSSSFTEVCEDSLSELSLSLLTQDVDELPTTLPGEEHGVSETRSEPLVVGSTVDVTLEVNDTVLSGEAKGVLQADDSPLSQVQNVDSVVEDTSGEQPVNVSPLGGAVPGQERSQTEVSGEYVNISSVSSDGAQTLLSETGSDDVVQASSDLDLGDSRASSDLDLPGGQAGSTGSSDTSKFDSSMDTVVDRSLVDTPSEADHDTTGQGDEPYSLFGEKEEGFEKEEREKLAGSEGTPASLSSSYVKCMIEEAMEESKTEDSGSDNHSSGEKSESSKVDSEFEKSVYSGHESSDDIETTTSSDIEILQAPSANDESKFHTSFDLSPLKIALQKTAGAHGHRRSDSQSSSSAHSKSGELDHPSPERGESSLWRDDDSPHHDLQAVREEGVDNPYHPERLLKLCQRTLLQELSGGQKLAEMAEVLQARENKLIQLSKDNHQLMEDNSILRNQLQQSEEARETETADLTAVTNEFTARLSESEKKIQQVLKEKENVKQQLGKTEEELKKRSANVDLEAELEEKTEQVEQLMAEGEKLSRQQLQSNNIIKKLRAKEKETETTITGQKKKLETQTAELERLTVVLDSKEEMEKTQGEAINQLNAAVQKQEKELSKLRSELEDSQEKCRGLQAALDNSYKEIAELHRSNASQDSKAQEAALSAESHVREELKAAMEREQQRFRQEREAFIMQADDLRLDMTRLEKEHSRREELLRQEITHLQERLQEGESRSQELSQTVSSATRPLLRQIENLQATYGAQATAWEKVEKNLTDRLAEAQTAVAMAQEKERTGSERVMELSARVTSLEASNSRLKQEKAQLVAQGEADRGRLEELEDNRHSVVAQLETSRQRMVEELNQLKVDKVHLESQLGVERTRLETEMKKGLALEEQLRLAERERPRSRGTPSPSPSMSVSRQESLVGSMHERQSPGWSWSFHEDAEAGGSAGTLGKSSVYDSLRHSGAAVVVENMQAQLKQKEGEITQLQSEIQQLERTRESMARELVDLSNQNEELKEKKAEHEKLQTEFQELSGRYSALLQMYGEKEEQVQELRLDLQDVKEMYKTQIDTLLAK
ncbi:TATA element modulatory factor [Aplysia californica]|uniref:TATA element modulatory factor n=1 Tax=Aplysia californica TaxID=6500 RepID=A0ABM0ZV00_APLCA|nr:TATA element modulatory factor [Aplysia californica]